VAETTLLIDQGNTRLKWVLARNGEIDEKSAGQGDLEILMQTCRRDTTIKPATVLFSSVSGKEDVQALQGFCKSHWGTEAALLESTEQRSGVRNAYPEPGMLGVDRWLAMLGARQRVRGRVCVVDAGSALTVDIVAADGRHEGGYIIPGPALMERALLLDTDRVRFAEEAGYDLSPGSSTAEAVRHGVALAQAGAVALAIDRCVGEPLQLLFCGGGGGTLKELLSRGGDYAPDLVFEGLEAMAAYS